MTPDVHDLRIEVRIKNALLYNALMDRCGSLAKQMMYRKLPLFQVASDLSGVGYQTICDYVGLRRSPYSKRYKGELVPSASTLCEFLDVSDPKSIFPQYLYETEDLGKTFVTEAKYENLLLTSRQAVDPEGEFELHDATEKAMETLTEREKNILSARFGLSGGGACTLEEAAEEDYIAGYSNAPVTRDRVRQIEAKALRKLRDPSRAKFLRTLAGRERLIEP